MLSPAENDRFIGHRHIETLFLQHWQNGNMPHSLLFCGPRGVGKASFAFRLARFVLAGGNESGGLFGGATTLDMPADAPVFRRMMGGSHGDFLYITPDAKGATPTIKVDAVREISTFLAHTPSESQWRVVIIDAADDMNPNAANALLKVLEEPPSYCIILLISHRPGLLLPTIRSRCRVVEFASLSEAQFSDIVQQAVETLTEADLLALYALSFGSPGFAIQLYHQGAVDLYALTLESVLSDSPSAEPSRQQLLKRLTSSKDNALWSIWQHVWEMWLYRVAMCAQGVSLPFLSDADEQAIGTLSQRFSAEAIAQLRRFAQEWFADETILHLDRKQIVTSLLNDTGRLLRERC